MFEEGRTNFRIQGTHKGSYMLLHSQELDYHLKNQTFTSQRLSSRIDIGKIIRRLFEGINNSYAPYDLEAIKLFVPFSRDSEGGIQAMFYAAGMQTGTGDIFIDCDYSKCFNIFNDDTLRYIQNIAGWTARPEIHLIHENAKACEWRPNL